MPAPDTLHIYKNQKQGKLNNILYVDTHTTTKRKKPRTKYAQNVASCLFLVGNKVGTS